MKTNTLYFSLLLSLALLLAACQGARTNPAPASPTSTIQISTPVYEKRIPFQTVFKHAGTSRHYYLEKEPRMMIITAIDEIGNIESWVSEEASGILEKIDYERHLGIAVFHGYRPAGEHHVNILNVFMQDKRITIDAELIGPPGDELIGAITSPYEIIVIDKEELPGKLTFVLAANTEFLEETEVNLEAEPVYLPVIIDQ